jgi:hypothetical protein
MPKFYLTGFFLLLFFHCFCQQKLSDSSNVVQQSDSLKQLDSTLAGDSVSLFLDTPKSYVQAGIGIGNNLYSIHNNILNSKQATPTVVFTPSIAYFHKSGFNLTAAAYLLTDKNKFGVNQYAITPGYETAQGKDFDFIASYTHYFVQDVYSKYASPIQNDLYASLVYKKPLIQPGIAIGYSAGTFKDNKYLDTTVANVRKMYYDSTSNTLESFSFIPSIQHAFDWYVVFCSKDEIIFTPSIMLNFANNNTAITQDNTNVGGNSALVKRIKKIINKRLEKFQQSPFQLQSVGVNLDVNYQLGNFAVAPELYVDYYTQQTNANKFSEIYAVNLTYSF